jgi:hypothetical protein
VAADEPVERNDLDLGWRIALAVAAAAVTALGVYLLVAPPTHTAFAPQATSAAQRAKVADSSPATAAVVIGIGAVLLLVAANGRKIASVKVGDDEVAFALSRAAAKSAGEKAVEQALAPDQIAAAVSGAAAQTYARVRTGGPAAVDIDEIARDAVSAVAPRQ